MKNYLRLFLSIVFLIFILNVAQAEVPKGITQAEVLKDITQAEVPEDITQAEVPKDITQAEVPKDITQAEVPEDIIQEKIPEDITQALNTVWKFKFSGGGYGTAFFIGPNQVVTNFHVMLLGQKDTSYNNLVIDDFSLEQGDKRLNLKKVLYASAVDDLVILETKEEVSDYLNVSKEKPSRSLLEITYPEGLLISPMIRNLGRLFALGYPRGVKQTFIHSEKHGVMDDGYNYEMSVNQVGLEGLSGGPVLNEKKEVIGVAYRVTENRLNVIKMSRLEKLRRGLIGLDCSDISLLSSCIELEIENLKERARQKDRIAQFALADSYHVGKGVKKKIKKAFKWWLESARHRYAPAQHKVAIIYYRGEGVKEDKEEAFYWMEQAARQGFVPSKYELSLMYYAGSGVDQDDEKAFYWMEKAAEQGYAPAQYQVAIMYSEGRVVDPSDKKAFDWMEQAARQGYPIAQHGLAIMYLNGRGVAPSDKKAFDWMEQAARQGYPRAQYELARLYYKGRGVDQSDKKAFDWMEQAAKRNHAEAQEGVALMYDFGIGVKPDKTKAFQWRKIKQLNIK